MYTSWYGEIELINLHIISHTYHFLWREHLKFTFLVIFEKTLTVITMLYNRSLYSSLFQDYDTLLSDIITMLYNRSFELIAPNCNFIPLYQCLPNFFTVPSTAPDHHCSAFYCFGVSVFRLRI